MISFDYASPPKPKIGDDEISRLNEIDNAQQNDNGVDEDDSSFAISYFGAIVQTITNNRINNKWL